MFAYDILILCQCEQIIKCRRLVNAYAKNWVFLILFLFFSFLFFSKINQQSYKDKRRTRQNCKNLLFPLNGEIAFALFLCLLLVVCVVDVLILLYQDFEEDEIEVD